MKYIVCFLLVLSGCGKDIYEPGLQGPKGDTGATGEQGEQGIPGTNGSSCTVNSVSPSSTLPHGGAIITCTDGTSVLITNDKK